MMTIEQRLEQLELQNQRIERKNKRLTAALAVMAVACALFVNPTIPPLSLKTRRRIPLGKGFNR